ncbi:hypothetical protein COLO4_06550 [Corchorus olitorius]|uniref:Uncharacterized protein n=1 Tax=Corchorus olitorius TaxID=93759 RepID=A0A1R3KMS3_9ROSI|nr:hypothetical protein COLO4_06550 [Corchorus olitorius]
MEEAFRLVEEMKSRGLNSMNPGFLKIAEVPLAGNHMHWPGKSIVIKSSFRWNLKLVNQNKSAQEQDGRHPLIGYLQTW